MNNSQLPNPYLSPFRWALLLSLAAAVAFDWVTDEIAQMLTLAITLMGLIASVAFLWGAWRMMKRIPARVGQVPEYPKPIPPPPWGPSRKVVEAALVEIEVGERRRG